MFYMTDY